MSQEKTNAMRVLEGKKIPYQAFTYSPEIHVATEVAATLGFPASEVYKTLVVLREKGKPLLVMVASEKEIDLRRLAKSVDEKSLRMALRKEAERLTGLQVGGISALALLNKGFDIYIDRPALGLEYVLVSAGKRGINLRLRVNDLVAVTGARPVEATAAAENA
ncbi:MAG: aminoacyl-tRNA deacylase [Chloroflexi bacterium]|nr:aminoacyl-tRNA deacylase [Chloroflexota bacterium]MCL5110907.1 aminoacyl-tRNA deacylase [Chloroflexota bacterium]